MNAEQIREWLAYSPPPNPEHDQTLGWIDENGQWLCPLCSSRLLGRGCSHAMRGAKPTYDETGLKCVGCGPLSVEIEENPPMIENDGQNDFEDSNTGCASAVDAEAILARSRVVHADFGPRQHAIAANPDKPEAYEVYSWIRNKTKQITAENLMLSSNDMLGERRLEKGISAKLGKSADYSFWTPGLYLASGGVAGFDDLCKYASHGCRKNCLLVSGQRAGDKKTALEIIGRLRRGEELGVQTNVSLLRTYLYLFNYPEFVRLVNDALVQHAQFAMHHGLEVAVRLNATSDVPWEEPDFKHHGGHSFILDNPDIQFYDYTKDPHRMMRYATDPTWPKNYYITFSYSEVNMIWCLIALKLGVSITVPFDGSLGKEFYKLDKAGRKHKRTILPKTFLGKNVVDGDLFDMRFFESRGYWEELGFGPPPYVVGLRVKGNEQKAHALENDFFFDAALAEGSGNDIETVKALLHGNLNEAIRQHAEFPSDEQLNILHPEIRDLVRSVRS